MKSMMRIAAVVVVACLALGASAEDVSVLPQLPDGTLPDTEVYTNVALNVQHDGNMRFSISIDAASCTSNEVLVAIGCDADSDGDERTVTWERFFACGDTNRETNALVTFTGDGYSALPDPTFIARAGDTNRVILLIGKTYQVTSRMPIVCIGRSSGEIEVNQISATELSICWPVTIEVESVECRVESVRLRNHLSILKVG